MFCIHRKKNKILLPFFFIFMRPVMMTHNTNKMDRALKLTMKKNSTARTKNKKGRKTMMMMENKIGYLIRLYNVKRVQSYRIEIVPNDSLCRPDFKSLFIDRCWNEKRWIKSKKKKEEEDEMHCDVRCLFHHFYHSIHTFYRRHLNAFAHLSMFAIFDWSHLDNFV